MIQCDSLHELYLNLFNLILASVLLVLMSHFDVTNYFQQYYEHWEHKLHMKVLLRTAKVEQCFDCKTYTVLLQE